MWESFKPFGPWRYRRNCFPHSQCWLVGVFRMLTVNMMYGFVWYRSVLTKLQYVLWSTSSFSFCAVWGLKFKSKGALEDLHWSIWNRSGIVWMQFLWSITALLFTRLILSPRNQCSLSLSSFWTFASSAFSTPEITVMLLEAVVGFGFHIVTLSHSKMGPDFSKKLRNIPCSCPSSGLCPVRLLQCLFREANCLWEVLCFTVFQWHWVSEFPFCCNRFLIYFWFVNIQGISSQCPFLSVHTLCVMPFIFYCTRWALFLYVASFLMAIIWFTEPQLFWPLIY